MQTSNRIERIEAKYEFNDDEKKEIATHLAQCQIELQEADEQRRSILAGVSDKIKRTKLDITRLSRQYRDGYEFREVECNVFYDYEKKEKTYRSKDEGTIIDRRPFAPGDEQRRFA